MAKFLSETGLQTVWSKIDSLFVRKVSVSSSNNTASFGSAVTVGSVGGVDLKFTMPSNPVSSNTVTTSDTLTADKIILGNGTKTVKTSTYGITTTAPSSSSDNTTIPTSKAVWSAFGSVASALKYKGTIASSGGTVTALPASHAVGDVYVVKTAGTYAGKACEVGDYIICNTAGTSANDAHWDVLNGENQVENKSASLAAAGSSATIATVDGTDLTVTTPSTWTGLTKAGTVTSVTLTSGTGITVSNSGTAITGSGSRTISLNKATTSVIGGMIPSNVLTTAVSLTSANGSTSSRYYGVQMDKDGKAFVNVPWTSVSDANIKISDGTTTNTIITAACIGTSSKTNTLTISASQNITATVGGTGGAATLTLTGPDLSSYLTSHQTIKQDGITGATVTRFGTCGTAAATAAKTVSVGSGTVTLEAGLRVTVKFTYANTANSPTLNVNSKGAKNIYHKGSQITTGSNKALLAGTVDFVYDGTQWQLIGNYLDTDTHNTHALTVTNGAASATTGEITYVESVTGCDATSGNLTATTTRKKINVVSSHQTIKQDGITGATINRYGTCSTGASTAAKTVSVSGGTPTLETGLKVTVYFSAKNTASNPTLNVNSLGAKKIYHNGALIASGTNKGLLYGAVDLVYNSTLNSNAGAWQLIGNYIDTNSGGTVTSVTLTSGTGITVSDSGTAITSSGSRTISLASGVATAGTYKSVTVDTYGRVTAGTNPTTLSGYGITDALPLSGGTMTGDITLNGASVLPLTDATSGATSGLGYLGSSSRRFRAGYIRDIYTSYFNFIDGDTAATLGSINFMQGAAFLRPVDETNSNKFFDYKFYVNSTNNGFFYEEGTGVCVPLGKADHRWSKVWATDADFSGNFYIGGSIYPSTDLTSYLGTSSYRFHSACIVNHYTRNIVFKNQTSGNDCVQLWGGDGYLRVATGTNINTSKKEIIFHESYGLYPEVGTTTNLGYYSSTDNRFRWANVYAVNGNFSGTIVANGQTVLDESMALTTSEIDTILANAT